MTPVRAITAFAAVALVIVGSAVIAVANAIIDTDIDLDDDDG